MPCDTEGIPSQNHRAVRHRTAFRPNADHVRPLEDADAVVVRLFEISADHLASCERLKVIAKHDAGVDNIDVVSATTRDIPVVYTPGANANAVAEQTLTLVMTLARHVFAAGAALREGRFEGRDRYQGVELAGKTLGVIGVGRIGQRIAAMAHPASIRFQFDRGRSPVAQGRRSVTSVTITSPVTARLQHKCRWR